jgi:hypothetical protein
LRDKGRPAGVVNGYARSLAAQYPHLQALSKLPAFTDRSAPKLSALLKVVVTTGAGSVSSKQLYSATTAALLKAAPSPLGLEPADGLQVRIELMYLVVELSVHYAMLQCVFIARTCVPVCRAWMSRGYS